MLYERWNSQSKRELVTVEKLEKGINELASPPMEYDPNDFKDAIEREYALIKLVDSPETYEVNGFGEITSGNAPSWWKWGTR